MRRTVKSSSLSGAVAVVAALLLSISGTRADAAPEAQGEPGPGDRPAAEQTSVVEYGPYTIGQGHTGNQFDLGIEKPCTDCYITGMTADLIDTSGNTVGVRDGQMLHHMVLFNQNDGRTDATCNVGLPFPLGWLYGQRFFASGDERTALISPPGYGYYVGSGGTWNLIWELMNMTPNQQTLSLEMTFQWIPASEVGDMTEIEPVWLDLDQCGDSQISLPAGEGTASWTWNVNRPGTIIGIGGHVHNGGINTEITNDTTGELICDSVASYGEDPLYIRPDGTEFVSSMSTCGGAADPTFGSTVSSGDQVTLTGHYDMPEAVDDQMGIAVAYIAEEDDAGGGECAWWDWWCWFLG